MTDLIIKGGTVIDQTGMRRADVAIADGSVIAVEPDIDPTGSGAQVIDASNAYVAPGLIDIQVHFRQPGREEAETIESGARAAALGGFTAVVTMPNTEPTTDSPEVVRAIQAWAEKAVCDVFPSAAITVGRQGTQLTPMAELAALGVRMFTDDGDGVQDDDIMRQAMQVAKPLGVVLSQHCETKAISRGGSMNEGAVSAQLGIHAQPPEAETSMVLRDIELVRQTGARAHFLHLSAAASIEAVRQAKAEGLPVSAEAAPHHFTLTDECCTSFDPVFKMNPPLRTAADVQAIKQGFADGTIDAIATDHAPHAPHLKEQPFEDAPFGVLGLETSLSLSLTELGLPIEDVIGLLTWRPARIALIDDLHGRPIAVGEPANLVVIDADATWKRDKRTSQSRSKNDPFDGRTMKGMARHTVHHGTVVVLDGELTR